MKIHRFIINFKPDDKVSGSRPERRGLKSGSLKLEDPELFNQVRNVLKLRVGENIILADGSGNEAVADITEYGKDFVTVSVGEVRANSNEPEQDVILYCSILKRENFELVVQKATEIGVKTIVPIVTERTVKLNVKQERLEKIIKEAAEQSGRGGVPVLLSPVDLDESIKTSKEYSLNLFFDGSGESFRGLERHDNKGQIGLWIGPEGGWTEKEIESARKAGFKIINLGKLTLRAETAAITATYIVVHNFIAAHTAQRV